MMKFNNSSSKWFVFTKFDLYESTFQLIQNHRIVLLGTMAKIIGDTPTWEDIDLTKELIHLASSEMTKTKVDV